MQIRYVELKNKEEWYLLARHLLMKHWENDMKTMEYGMLMTSTQVDENAQHFYRKLDYKDCGGFIVDVPGYEQPTEMIMIKAVQ